MPSSHLKSNIWSIKFTNLDIYKWLVNKHKIGFDTLLKLSVFNSTPKINSWRENCLNSYKDYCGHILNDRGV